MRRQPRTIKSHHGCSESKRRTVKCDEKRPQCSNCKNRLATCHYATSGPWVWAETSGCHDLKIAKTEAMMLHEPVVSSHSAKQTVSQHASHATLTSMSQFNTQHLRFLLNWTTSTSYSISRNHADSLVWQKVIPQRALSCPYLLHGIFTVSALHLALSSDCHGTEQQALIEDAQHHQSEAIRMFTKNASQLGPSEQLESFALSSLLIGSAFAFPLAVSRRCQTETNSLDELIGVFILIRKMINFSTPTMSVVQKSELGDLLLVEEDHSSLSDSSRLAIGALYELLNASCSPQHESYQAFAYTIDCLEGLLSKLDGAAETISRSFIWVCEVPAAFIDLLQRHNPLALVILAHYCVVLHHLRKRWWISSWGERVLDVIVQTLDTAWKPSIVWALHAISAHC